MRFRPLPIWVYAIAMFLTATQGVYYTSVRNYPKAGLLIFCLTVISICVVIRILFKR